MKNFSDTSPVILDQCVSRWGLSDNLEGLSPLVAHVWRSHRLCHFWQEFRCLKLVELRLESLSLRLVRCRRLIGTDYND